MTAFLQQTPHLHFSLALIELQTYRLPNENEILVAPVVVARTQEVVRAVVRIDRTAGLHTSVQVSVSSEDLPGLRSQRSSLSREDFLQRFRENPRNDSFSVGHIEGLLQLCDENPDLEIRWNVRSFAILARVGTPVTGLPSLLSVGDTGVVRFHDFSFRKNLHKRGISLPQAESIHRQYLAGLTRLFSEAVKEKVLYFDDGPHLSELGVNYHVLESLIVETVRTGKEALLASVEWAAGSSVTPARPSPALDSH